MVLPTPGVTPANWGAQLNAVINGITPFRLRSGQWWTGPEACRSTGGAGANPSGGYLCVVPILVPEAVTVTGIGCYVIGSAAGATFRMGIYNDSGTMQPGSLLLDAGTVSGASNGVKTITISQALAGGIYWLAGVQQGSADCIVVASNVCIPIPSSSADSMSSTDIGLQGWANNGGTTGALPGTFTATYARYGLSGSNAAFRILLQAA